MGTEDNETMLVRLMPELGLFWLAMLAWLLRWLMAGTASTRWGWALLIVFGPSLLLMLRALSRDRRLQRGLR